MSTESAVMPTYARMPIAFERGAGAWLYDRDGRRYLDALCGLAVTGLGHAHPQVTAAIREQAGRLLHTSNLYEIEGQTRLANRLAAMTGMERVFFGNSGAEANEAAIKLARLYGHGQGVDTPAIVVTDGAFHGRTLATLTATGNRKVQAGFEPLVAGFVRAPYGDVDTIATMAANNRDIVAVFVEPIQGEGGVITPPDGYLAGLRRLCDEHGWLLMLDEIQTGTGRTGTFFAYQGENVLPDVVTVAKGLGNGVPIGACLARGAAANVLTAGTHGSTFGGNPLSCAAGNAVLDALEDGTLMANAAAMGERIRARIADGLKGDNRVAQIRGRGLMIGIELSVSAADVVQKAMDAGVLLNVCGTNVVRLLPPLIIDAEQADQVADTVIDIVKGLE